jgi:regulator of sirC expression with transglutaminase-like and TPR domain
MDDPDEVVYNSVSDKILSFGKEIIPNLENLWENTPQEQTQERIKQIIHKLHFEDLTNDFISWKNSDGDLLRGALLVAKYQFPEMQDTPILKKIEKIRRNIWLELNNYLTPLEQVNIITSILYNYYQQKGLEVSYNQPDDFLINKTIENNRGNALSNGILYLILCQLLDISVNATNIPKQFVLGYFNPQHEFDQSVNHGSEKIFFFIDPLNGNIHSHKDIEKYFNRISILPSSIYFKPLNNKKIIRFLLEELSKCFNDELNAYKKEELLSLVKLLDE